MKTPEWIEKDEVFRAVVEQLRIDRVQVQPVAPKYRKIVLILALLTIAGLYWWGWGSSTIRAVDVLLNANGDFALTPLDDSTVRHQTWILVEKSAIVACAVLAFLIFRGKRPPRPRMSVSIKTYFLATLATTIGFLALVPLGLFFGAMGFESLDHYPERAIDGVWPLALETLRGAMAGPTEEIVLMALVVVALRRAGQNWWIIILVANIVRVPFHLYYGWEAIGLAVWATLIVLLYKRTNSLIPIIAEHAIWNTHQTLADEGIVSEGWILVPVIGVAVIICSMYFKRDGLFIARAKHAVQPR
ncbi:CPBP family intramembrane glutamic endopeptidase [Glutamicibacter ardleyensis]|uniref:CPBP family intramembrane glutamic endopeptidase n=1 Tax=Glutamicibacter ardleyensis TaxID=225894 RepID=UPI003FD4D0A9